MKRKSILTAIAILFIALSSIAQSSKESKKKEDKQSDLLDFSAFKGKTNSETSTFTDSRDGKTYKTVKIGTQTWMAENLAYKASSGCWAYNDTLSYVSTYGYLYNWETAKTGCPSSWHLPSDAEWTTIIDYLGGKDIAGGKLKSSTGWYNWNVSNKKQTNSSGFTALPGGERDSDGNFEGVEYRTFWWSSTLYDPGVFWFFFLEHSDIAIGKNANAKIYGYSVRCIKD